MKLRKTKKGFTVVELVIVIAVIAVLAAILIPTFISLDSRAKKASDQSLVKNLNVALAAREGEADDTKNNTMHDAVEDLEKWGYKLDALVTKSGEDLLWNMKTNRFLLEKDLSKEENKDKKVDFWRIQKTLSASDEFSVYASDEFTGPAADLKVGFDAGDNDDIPSVSYIGGASAQEVVIRTNGGTVTVNSPSDTVKHYGDANKIDILAVDLAHSYHEYGNVAFTKIAQGHYVAESGSNVTVLVATGGNTEVKVDNNGGQVDRALATDPQTAGAGNQGSANLDYFDTTGSGSVEEALEDLETGAVLFAGGIGTATDPFLIANATDMQNITTLYSEKYNYFKVKDGVTTIDCRQWTPLNLNGSFDGNGVKLQNIDARLFLNIGAMGQNGVVSSWSTEAVTVGNFDAYFQLEGDMDAAGGMAKQILGNNTTTLSNIRIYGSIVSGSNSGALFSYSTGNPYSTNQNVNQIVLINDCHIYATLVSTSSSVAVVSGYPNYCNPGIKIVINNPDDIWQGSASNPAGKINFVTMSSWSIPEGGTANRSITCTKLNTVALTKQSDGAHTVAQTTNASVVKAYISAQLTETDANGNQTAVAGITMAVQKMGEYELNGETKVLDPFSTLKYTNKCEETSATLSGNTLDIKIAGPNNYTFGTIKLVVIECDSNGNVLSYQIRNIASKTINASSWTVL